MLRTLNVVESGMMAIALVVCGCGNGDALVSPNDGYGSNSLGAKQEFSPVDGDKDAEARSRDVAVEQMTCDYDCPTWHRACTMYQLFGRPRDRQICESCSDDPNDDRGRCFTIMEPLPPLMDAKSGGIQAR